MHTHRKDGGIATTKKRERKHGKDHSVTHVKAKQNKNEMGITIPANNVLTLKKAKQNTKRQTLFA